MNGLQTAVKAADGGALTSLSAEVVAQVQEVNDLTNVGLVRVTARPALSEQSCMFCAAGDHPKPEANYGSIAHDLGLACVLVVVVMLIGSWLFRRFTAAKPAAPAPAMRGRHQAGAMDVALLLRIGMGLALGLVWYGAGALVIQAGRVESLPAWWSLPYAAGFLGAAWLMWGLLGRWERRQRERERAAGGAWVVAMARKVQS